MSTRRTLWIAIIVLAIAIVIEGSVFLWLFLRSDIPSSDDLVAFGPDMPLQLVLGGDLTQTLAEDVDAGDYRFPTVAPDGRSLVYVGVEDDVFVLFQVDLESQRRTELFRNATAQPFAMGWSPDSRYVSFLANLPSNLGVYVVRADGAEAAQQIAAAQQAYMMWSQDSQSLLMHVNGHQFDGGRVEIYRLGATRPSTIANDPGFFFTPAWVLDSDEVFYVLQPPIVGSQPTGEDLANHMVRMSVDGDETEVLSEEPASIIRMVRAPNNNQIAYIRQGVNSGGSISGRLSLVDENGEISVVTEAAQNVLTFFWSPDGNQIAYLSQVQSSASILQTWHIFDVESASTRSLSTFQPSETFVRFQLFFDAFIDSFSPWSADGTRLLYGADDGVYTLDVADGQTTRVADGEWGVWVGR
ncbi:MAG: hypothetical protein AAGF95_10265 [Chloroflexota bacterium]